MLFFFQLVIDHQTVNICKRFSTKYNCFSFQYQHL